MTAKSFLSLCLYTILAAFIGYASVATFGDCIDKGGALFFVAALVWANLIGVGYWAIAAYDSKKYKKLPKIVNLAILIATTVIFGYVAGKLFIAGQIVIPIIMSILFVAGGLAAFITIRKKRL